MLGFIFLLAFLTVLITAIVEMRSGQTAVIVSLFAASAVLLAGLVISQSAGSNRLVAPELLSRRPFQAATLAGFGTGLGIVAIMAFSPTYFVAELGMTTLEAGAVSTVWSATSAVAAILFSRLSARFSGPMRLIAGLFGVSIGIVLMAGVSSSGGFTRLFVGLLIAGIATGLLNGGLARQAVATVPLTDAPTGTAANNSARYLGAASGVSDASIVASGADMAAGWDRIVWATLLVSVLTGAVVVWSRRERSDGVSAGHGRV